MANINDTGLRTFTSGAALPLHTIVKSVAGVVTAAGVSDAAIGTVTEPTTASGQPVTVRMFNVPGTCKMIAAGIIAVDADVFQAADGEITATVGGIKIGRALAASGADQDVIEVVWTTGEVSPAANVAALTDSTGLTPDTTIADVTPASAITDNSGGVDPGDDTIAAVTNLHTITDSTGGTPADGTVANLADGTTYANDHAAIENNFATIAAELAIQKNANTALLAAIAQLAAKLNTTSTAVGVLEQNESDMAGKINAILSSLKTADLMKTA